MVFSGKVSYIVRKHPIVRFLCCLVIIGIIFSFFDLAVIGLILLLGMLLFQVITLPVEFNASSRAKKQLIELNLIENYELNDSRTMLNAAALTYVASVLTTLLQILRLALIVFALLPLIFVVSFVLFNPLYIDVFTSNVGRFVFAIILILYLFYLVVIHHTFRGDKYGK